MLQPRLEIGKNKKFFKMFSQNDLFTSHVTLVALMNHFLFAAKIVSKSKQLQPDKNIK